MPKPDGIPDWVWCAARELCDELTEEPTEWSLFTAAVILKHHTVNEDAKRWQAACNETALRKGE
jgi:hypothetical protein